MSPERVPPCPAGDTSPRAQSSWLKLLHINATARLEAPGYQGPFLPPEALGGDRDKDKDREKATPLQRGLREALLGALGCSDLVRHDVSTVYGWDIGECHPLPPAWAPSTATPGPGTHPGHPWHPPPLLPSPVTLQPCHLPVTPQLCHLHLSLPSSRHSQLLRAASPSPVTFLGHPPGTHCPVTFPCHPPAHPSPVTHPVTFPCHPHLPLAAQSNSVPVPQCRGPATGCHSNLRAPRVPVPSRGTRADGSPRTRALPGLGSGEPLGGSESSCPLCPRRRRGGAGQ